MNAATLHWQNQQMKTQMKDKSTALIDFKTGGPTMECQVLRSAGAGITNSGKRSQTGEISGVISLIMVDEEK